MTTSRSVSWLQTMPTTCLMMIACLTGLATWPAFARAQDAPAGVLGRPLNVALTLADRHAKLIIDTTAIFADRKEYWADDDTGQFLIALKPPAVEGTTTTPAAADTRAQDDRATGHQEEGLADQDQSDDDAKPAKPLAARMVAVLSRLQGQQAAPVDRVELAGPVHPKFHLAFAASKLPVGDYQLTAWLEDDAGRQGEKASWDFKKTDRKSDAPAFPADGLPVVMDVLPDGRKLAVPVTLSIPLPRQAVKDVAELALMREGKEVPAQFQSLATWGVGGSIRWAQAKFTAQYDQGKAEGYRLVRRGASRQATPGTQAPGAQPPGIQAPAVRVEETADHITLDNGTLRLAISKKKFTGIDKAWYDASGQGKYDLNAPIIAARDDDAGPFLMDERLTRFTAAADKAPEVIVEEAGPQSVTVLATGWYTDRSKRLPPLCQYRVRMTLAAGQSMADIVHHTIITFDSRLHMIRDLGFAITYTGAQQYAFGVDGQAVAGKLPQNAPIPPQRPGEQTTYAGVYMHQQTWDRCVVVNEKKQTVPGSKSDGWVATWVPGRPVLSMTLANVWEKFPKELQARHEAILVHAWPAHGKRVFPREEELDLKNIYKYWNFHQHRMLDFKLPQDYYEVLEGLSNTETRETRAEHALNGNAQGMTITTHMTLHVSPPVQDKQDAVTAMTATRLADARLAGRRPFATLPPQWNAGSCALEPSSAVNPDFQEFEDTILNGTLAYARTVEHGQAYGMLIWPNIHTYWLPAENRASLHRTWLNSHYHNVGNNWVLWFRSGDRRMLQWARDNSLHMQDVQTIAYAEPASRDTAIKFHLPGAMYHCKGCTPWGSETYGMIRRDGHAGLWGHWVDANAHLWAWLIDGDPRARDLYTLWLSSLRQYGYLSRGVRREANTTLALLVSAYEFSGDADFLPAIWNLGRTLRTAEPLERQNPGPMWHPLWINRYYQLTRDPEYVPFILEYARRTSMGNTVTIGLAALAYELSGDKTYLTQHQRTLERFPRRVYRQEGHPYDYYGMGPGPMGMNWVEMGVGPFMRAMKKADIHSFPSQSPEPEGFYPLTWRLKNKKNQASSELYGLSRAGGQIDIHSFTMGVEGDAHRGQWVVIDQDGKTLNTTPSPQGSRVNFSATVQAAPQSLTHLNLETYGGISMATTGFDAHASLLEANRRYLSSHMRGFIEPYGTPAPATFTFTVPPRSGRGRIITSVILRDGRGKVVHSASICPFFENTRTAFTLDPQKHPLPWELDVLGANSFTMESDVARWIIAPTPADLSTMKPLLQRHLEKASDE